MRSHARTFIVTPAVEAKVLKNADPPEAGKLTAPDLSLNFGSFKLQAAFASIRNNSEYPKSQIKPHDSPSEIHKGDYDCMERNMIRRQFSLI